MGARGRVWGAEGKTTSFWVVLDVRWVFGAAVSPETEARRLLTPDDGPGSRWLLLPSETRRVGGLRLLRGERVLSVPGRPDIVVVFVPVLPLSHTNHH